MDKALVLVRTVSVIISMLFFVLLMQWRGSHEGQVCSGAFLSSKEMNSDKNKNLYEFSKGKFLKFIMIYYFIVIIVVCCFIATACYRECVACQDAFRKERNDDIDDSSRLSSEQDADLEIYP